MNIYKLVNNLSIALLVCLGILFTSVVYRDAQTLVSQSHWLKNNEVVTDYLRMLDAIDEEVFATMRVNQYMNTESENARRLQILITNQAYVRIRNQLGNSRVTDELFEDLIQKRQAFDDCMRAYPKCHYSVQEWGVSLNELQLVLQNSLKKHQESYLFNSTISSLKDLSQQMTRWNSQFHRLLVYIELYQDSPSESLRKMILNLSLVLGENSLYLNSDPELIEGIPGFWKKILEFSAVYQEVNRQVMMPLELNSSQGISEVSSLTLSRLGKTSTELRDYLYRTIENQSKDVTNDYFFAFFIEFLIAVFILIMLVFVIYVIRNTALIPLAENETILREAAIGIIQINGRGQITRLNRTAEKIFGYDSKELMRESFLTLIPIRDRREIEISLSRYLLGEESDFAGKKQEVFGLCKDQTVVPIELSISEVQVTGKRQFIILVSNLTEQKAARREIFKQNQLLSILKGVTEHSVTHPQDLTRNLQSLVERLAKLMDAEFAFIAKVHEREHEETFMKLQALKVDQQNEQQNLLYDLRGDLYFGTNPNIHVLFAETTFSHEHFHVRGVFDELLCPVEYGHQVIIPIRQLNKVVGLIGLASSAPFTSSLRRFLEPIESTCNILFSNESFQHRQNDLIEQLEIRSKQALEAQQQSEIAAQAKSHFLANMSHEIRMPMNAVIGLTHLLLESSLSEKQRESLRKIQRSGHSLLGIINDILDFSKIEAGKLTLEAASFDLKSVVTHVFDMMSVNVGNKPIEMRLNYQVQPENYYFIGDVLRVEQVLTNLLSNALKFTKQGTIEVSATGSLLKNSKGEVFSQVHFSVKDSGVGISEEAQKTLFEEFTQADQSTTRQFGGTGLGLAISQHLIQLMGGEIKVNSQLGEGAEFWFEVTFPVAEPIPEESQVKDNRLGKPSTIDLRGWHILVVEDNPINQEIAIEFLASKGALVTIANNGKESLEILASNNPDFFDVVLMDLQMPIMSGYEATEKIREQACYDELPVVAMTAHAMQNEIDRSMRLGMQDYVTKPIIPEKFYAVLAGLKQQKMGVR